AELSFVAGRQHLKLGDRLLVKLRGGSAFDGVFVRVSVNQEIVISTTLAKHRISVIASRVGLPVDGYAGNELQQVQVVAAVDGEFGDLARRDGCAGGGSVALQQRHRISVDVYYGSDASDFQFDVEGYHAVERQLDVGGHRIKARRRDRQGVGSRG